MLWVEVSQLYQRLIAGSDDKEADFEVAFSAGAAVVWVIQKEPFPHNTMGYTMGQKSHNSPHSIQ